jgi:hypothetical protein
VGGACRDPAGYACALDHSTRNHEKVSVIPQVTAKGEGLARLLTPKIAPSFWSGFTVDSMAIDGFLNSLLSLLAAKF